MCGDNNNIYKKLPKVQKPPKCVIVGLFGLRDNPTLIVQCTSDQHCTVFLPCYDALRILVILLFSTTNTIIILCTGKGMSTGFSKVAKYAMPTNRPHVKRKQTNTVFKQHHSVSGRKPCPNAKRAIRFRCVAKQSAQYYIKKYKTNLCI